MMYKLKTSINSILIVDPEEINNKALMKIFTEYDLSVDIIDEHQDILKMLNAKKYDCVMLSNKLKYNQSFKSLDLIKSNYPWIIAIVLLSINKNVLEINSGYNLKSGDKDLNEIENDEALSSQNDLYKLPIGNNHILPILDEVFQFVRAGVDDFILKPFGWEDIEKILKYYYF